MSFNKLRFDECAYKHRLNESIGPLEYQLDRTNICEPCFVPSGVNVGGFGAAVCDNLIDVDSELLGLTRRASLCPAKKYIPGEQPFCQAKPLRECTDLMPEPTRLSNPACTLRCRGVNRFESLCIDPQDNALVPFATNINNRIIVKNSHRPCLPKPLDQTLALPKSGAGQHKELFCGTPREPHPLNSRTCNELKHY